MSDKSSGVGGQLSVPQTSELQCLTSIVGGVCDCFIHTAISITGSQCKRKQTNTWKVSCTLEEIFILLFFLAIPTTTARLLRKTALETALEMEIA